jgi:hypothetical protein
VTFWRTAIARLVMHPTALGTLQWLGGGNQCLCNALRTALAVYCQTSGHCLVYRPTAVCSVQPHWCLWAGSMQAWVMACQCVWACCCQQAGPSVPRRPPPSACAGPAVAVRTQPCLSMCVRGGVERLTACTFRLRSHVPSAKQGPACQRTGGCCRQPTRPLLQVCDSSTCVCAERTAEASAI